MQAERDLLVSLLTDNESGVRVRNMCAICPYQGDSPEKSGLIPYKHMGWHHFILKATADKDEHAQD